MNENNFGGVSKQERTTVGKLSPDEVARQIRNNEALRKQAKSLSLADLETINAGTPNAVVARKFLDLENSIWNTYNSYISESEAREFAKDLIRANSR